MANKKTKLHFSEVPRCPVDTLKEIGVVDTIQNISKEKYFHFDFDVYLPEFKMNLQRPYVWTDKMASAYIVSVFQERTMLPVYVNVKLDEDIIEVIDGKQRIMTLLRYYRNEFPMVVNGKQYYYSDLDENMQIFFRLYHVQGIQHYEHKNMKDTILTDKQKIDWFMHINCSNVPQNSEHISKLLNAKLKAIKP